MNQQHLCSFQVTKQAPTSLSSFLPFSRKDQKTEMFQMTTVVLLWELRSYERKVKKVKLEFKMRLRTQVEKSTKTLEENKK